MGTLIRLIGTTFSNPNLPLAQIPYGGIRDGLLGAYHLRHSLGMCKDLSGNGNHPLLRGQPEFYDGFIKTGNGKNGLITPIEHNQMQEFTFCSIIRRPSQPSTIYGFGVNTYSDGIGNNGGANIMGNSLNSAARHQVHVVSPVDPNAVVTVVKENAIVNQDEWIAVIMTVSASKGEVKGYYPKYHSTPFYSNFSTPVVHGKSSANIMIGYSEGSSNAFMDNAYAAVFSRALTEEEVATQYASMIRYAEAIGLGLV
ncbi:hypothetical protein ACUULL_003285 [Vibrio cholerae]